MTVEEFIVSLVKDVGFPIAVTFWFMFRTEKVIQRNSDAFAQFAESCKNYSEKK